MERTINKKRCFKISIDGVVQGVGFRPFVYNYAVSKGYKGSIRNTSTGVVIEIESDDPYELINYIRHNRPPLARIDSFDIQEFYPKELNSFAIIKSHEEGGFTHLSPDISVCPDCLSELFNPSDRRYLYPFINCTNCGPRYSIIKKIPYDRPNTTMSVFTMCDDCLMEYNNPTDRRFHAQPNACHKCGPQLSLIIDNSECKAANENILEASINILKDGGILAIKGIGGFHLACDAHNQDAVKRLRLRKRRLNKPFAMMSLDTETIRKYCEVSQLEAALLEDRRKPIVLLAKNKQISLPHEISPNNGYLGFMLPYTPLHYLLFLYPGFSQKGRGFNNFEALVMTSGNISEEPIAALNDEALARLASIADAFLLHNRDIFTRIDDSVVKIHNQRPIFIRRARGYIPDSIVLSYNTPDAIASGADIKNTFTLLKDNKAIISQHIGDLENIESIHFFGETLNNLKSVYRSTPAAIAHDLHPAYHSVKWALGISEKSSIKSYAIQHHHAHIASVMSEKNLTGRVIGVAFDGTGYGTDGNLWGSEFLICDPENFQRFAHFRYIPLPGGEMAIRECWRTAISYISHLADVTVHRLSGEKRLIELLESLGFIQKYDDIRIKNILKILNDRQFSPLSSGAGRLFDAVSALTGICDVNTFEGESASTLESVLAGQKITTSGTYPFMVSRSSPRIIDFSPLISQIIKDIRNGHSIEIISARFHNTLVKMIVNVSDIIRLESGINEVALSGGVFQNRYLAEGAFEALTENGFNVYLNEIVPCNDGGISLGQAFILNYKLKGSEM
jgi:hydrogenase maturation protein HypF